MTNHGLKPETLRLAAKRAIEWDYIAHSCVTKVVELDGPYESITSLMNIDNETLLECG